MRRHRNNRTTRHSRNKRGRATHQNDKYQSRSSNNARYEKIVRDNQLFEKREKATPPPQPDTPHSKIEHFADDHEENTTTIFEEGLRRRIERKGIKTEKKRFYYLKSDGSKGYITPDITIPDRLLVIEVDGPDHLKEPQHNTDRLRDQTIRNNGFQVWHFQNDYLAKTSNLIAVVKNIEALPAGQLPPHGPSRALCKDCRKVIDPTYTYCFECNEKRQNGDNPIKTEVQPKEELKTWAPKISSQAIVTSVLFAILYLVLAWFLFLGYSPIGLYWGFVIFTVAIIPTIIAILRNHRHQLLILVANIGLGQLGQVWGAIAWGPLLIYSMAGKKHSSIGTWKRLLPAITIVVLMFALIYSGIGVNNVPVENNAAPPSKVAIVRNAPEPSPAPEPIVISDVQSGNSANPHPSFLITNNQDEEVTLSITYTRVSNWFGTHERATEATIPAHDSVRITDSDNCSGGSCGIANIKYEAT